jgi:hypothetical protein
MLNVSNADLQLAGYLVTLALVCIGLGFASSRLSRYRKDPEDFESCPPHIWRYKQEGKQEFYACARPGCEARLPIDGD